MHYCNLFTKERYYLRVLLTIVERVQSFQHLYIADRILYFDFQATCITWDLLKDDQKKMQCFEKELLFTFGKSLCALFATLLIYREITDINVIWNIFANHFYKNLPY